MYTNDELVSTCFRSPQPVVLLRADPPRFTILGYNDAYKDTTYTHFRDITGWYLLEAFNPRFAGGDGAKILLEALDEAMNSKEKITTKVFQYNIPADNSGTMIECWWQLEIMPLPDETNRISELLITTNKITPNQ